MNTYTPSLQRALDNICYKDRSRTSLKSTDGDILELFSGDEKAAVQGLREFHLRHKNESVTIHEEGKVEVKIFGLFPEPEQTNQKTNWKKNRRFKDGKFPQVRPYEGGKTWKR